MKYDALIQTSKTTDCYDKIGSLLIAICCCICNRCVKIQTSQTAVFTVDRTQSFWHIYFGHCLGARFLSLAIQIHTINVSIFVGDKCVLCHLSNELHRVDFQITLANIKRGRHVKSLFEGCCLYGDYYPNFWTAISATYNYCYCVERLLHLLLALRFSSIVLKNSIRKETLISHLPEIERRNAKLIKDSSVKNFNSKSIPFLYNCLVNE